jgi:ornithine--oxo-acid transaminase
MHPERAEASVPFDLKETLAARQGENFSLYSRYVNPQLPRVLETLGFDRFYERGEGCYLYDSEGRRYLDLLSGFGVYALGRSHPAIVSALHEALDADLPNLVQLDCALLPGVLAEQLVARAHDGIERVFFTNSGAGAIETAIKFARCATQRNRILYCDHAFHGLTTGALSLNGGKEFRSGFGDLLPGADVVPYGDIAALERALRPGDVAALVIEPIQGKGVYLAPEDFWPAAQQLCRKHKTLLVIDEIQTGIGRTGTFFCHERYGVQPDIITVSKALSGGYIPVGATLASAKVVDAVYSSMDRAVVHSSTFSKNQLAMVAGLATLAAIDDEGIVENARVTGEAFMTALQPLVEQYEFLHEVRGKGLMIGLVFGAPESFASKMRFKAVEAMRTALFSQLVVTPLFHRHGILTQVAADNVNIIKLLPPLIAGEAEVTLFVDALSEVLSSLEKGSGGLLEFGRTVVKGSLHRARS